MKKMFKHCRMTIQNHHPFLLDFDIMLMTSFLLNSWFICLNKFVPKYLFCTYTLPHLSSHWKSMYIAPLFKPLTRPQYVEVTDCINKQHTYRVKDWEILINGFWNPFVGLKCSSPSIYQDRNKSLNHVNWQIFANICIGIV